MGSLLLDSFPYYTSALVLLVEFNMPFKSSLLFVAMLVGSCYGSCNRTISGYTWKFNATVDKDFSGITKEECAEKCLSVSWCKGYTLSLDDSSGSICHIFHELNQQHACQECSKCVSGVFTQISGVCSTEASNIIGVKSSSSEMSCIEKCAETSGCKYYSWGAGNIFSRSCFLFKKCSSTSSCEAWQSGQLQCLTGPKTIPQCSKYNILDDPTRRRTNGHGNYGDHAKNINATCHHGSEWKTSVDWKGAGWYRVQGRAGTKITETSPGEKHCGANSAGWLSGGHPSSVGSTVDRTVYYEWSGNAKEQTNTITITNCGAFFVYYLKEHWDCDNRYCTE